MSNLQGGCEPKNKILNAKTLSELSYCIEFLASIVIQVVNNRDVFSDDATDCGSRIGRWQSLLSGNM